MLGFDKELKKTILQDWSIGGESIYKILEQKEKEIEKYKNAFGEEAKKLRKELETHENRIKIKADGKFLQTYFENKNKGEKLFHWNFEFYNIFKKENSGFDVIIGNPPYIQLQKNGGVLANLYKPLNFETFERTGDIYALFIEKGVKLLKKNGLLCFITSNKWMRAGYGKSLRKFLDNKTNPIQLINLGPDIFKSATVDTNILLTENSENQNQLKGIKLTKESIKKKDIEKIFEEEKVEIKIEASGEGSWIILKPIEQSIKDKIEKIGTPLKDWNLKIYRGITTGFNDAFIIDKKKRDELIKKNSKNSEIIKPILRGRDIKKYHTEFKELYIISTFPVMKIKINDYPEIKKHLLFFGKERLEQIGKKLSDGTKSRKKTNNKWFETQDQIGYYKEFEKEKIGWQRVTKEPTFLKVEKEKTILDSMAFLTTDKNLIFILGILNSKIIKFYVDKKAHQYGTTGYLLSNQYVKKLPIPKPSLKNEKQVKKIEELVDEILKKKEEDCDANTEKLEKEIDEIVYSLYGLTNEEVKMIEEK